MGRMKLENKLEDIKTGALFWASAEQARKLSAELKNPSADLANYSRRNLVNNLFRLFRFEREVDRWCAESHYRTSASSLAGEMLAELGCDTSDEFMLVFVEDFEDPYLNRDGLDLDFFPQDYIDESTAGYAALKAFVENAL